MSPCIRRALRVLPIALAVVVAGCARTSTVPVDADTIRITVRVAPICDGKDADRLARRQAAVETIRRGFEDYVVVSSVGGDHLADEAPVTARTILNGDSTRALFSEDAPLLAHHRVLTVRMLRAGQGDSTSSVSARAFLGDDWEELVTKDAAPTCVGLGG